LSKNGRTNQHPNGKKAENIRNGLRDELFIPARQQLFLREKKKARNSNIEIRNKFE